MAFFILIITAALNYQTHGPMMDLNDALFASNGMCGYVIKPAAMREEVSYFSANARDGIPAIAPQTIHVKIISGQNLPKPELASSRGNSVDPYVRVEMLGVACDFAEERTQTVQHNGFSPVFDESFDFQVRPILSTYLIS